MKKLPIPLVAAHKERAYIAQLAAPLKYRTLISIIISGIYLVFI